MKANKIKTIDITALQWFDKVNGNSYFSAEIIINYSLKNTVTIVLPFQYGYGDYYKDAAFQEIKKQLNCFKKYNSYWKAYQDYKIITRYTKYKNCKKRDLIAA